MEVLIKEFLGITLPGSGYGSGSGDGYGDGSGSGDGYGSGYGSGDGYDSGDGDDSGDGSGYGSGDGDDSGDGDGYGDGSGYGYGDGDGDGYGSGIKSFDGKNVYIVDGVQTIFESIKGNIAKGYILKKDFTLLPTFVVKEDGKFAHGETLHEAFDALQEKLYDDSSVEERVSKFKEHFKDFSQKYPAKELFIWHHVLTGSCRQGRLNFAQENGIDIEKDSFTINEFINLTKNSYGGNTIKLLYQ